VPTRPVSDHAVYHGLAVRLVETGTYDTEKHRAYWPPGYPAFLAALYGVFGVSVLTAKLGNVLLAGLVVGELLGWIPPHRPVGAVPGKGELDPRYALTLLTVYGLLMALAAYLMTGLAEVLREGERKLRRANAELEQLSSLRRVFLHIALHDLKSPVGAIATLLNNLASGLGGPLTPDQTHWVSRGQKRLQDLLTFLRDLQILAELDTAQIAAQAKPVDLGALLRALAEEHQDLARQRRQTLRAEVPDGLPAAQGVERLLREAVANYFTNALKYTPEAGTILVRAGLATAPPGPAGLAGNFVRVEVEDNGLGIAPEDQGRLFQDFVRIPPKDQTGPPVSGTGLGLSIVRRIVEAHGGRAGVRSQPGQGATFYLEVPCAASRNFPRPVPLSQRPPNTTENVPL